MLTVSGISFYPERVPAVVVSPMVSVQIKQTPSIAYELQPVSAHAAAQWQQHPYQFNRTLQELYDMHGKIIFDSEAVGMQLNKFV